jgi:hypothetical protein
VSRDPWVTDLEWLTRGVRALRIMVEIRNNNMDRVTEKLKQAAGVAARSNAKLEAEADRLIAREDQFDQRQAEAFAPHHAVLDARHREMDQLEDALKIVSNADPLESSDAGEKQPAEQVSLHPGSDKAGQ